MSDQETLRLIAEVVDKYSGPIKAMQNSLKNLSDKTKDLNDKGDKDTKKHASSWKQLGENIREVKTKALDVAAPAFNALGLSVLSVSAAIASVAAATRDFGNTGRQFQFVGRAAKMSTDSIREWVEAGNLLGISQDQTIQSLTQFGAKMDALGRNAPRALQAYKEMPLLWDKLGRSLVGLNHTQQLDKIMKFVPTVRDTDQRKQVLAFYGLPEDWANLTDTEIQAMRAKGAEWRKTFPFSEENALKAQQAWAQLDSTIRGLKSNLEGAFAPGATEFLDHLNNFLRDDDGSIAKFKKSIGEVIALLPDSGNKTIFDALKTDMQDIEGMINATKWFWEKVKSAGDAAKANPLLDPNSLPLSSAGGGASSGWPNAGATGSWDSKKNEESVAKGTKQGLQDFFGSQGPGAGPGGMSPIAFHPSGGTGGGYFGSKEYPALDPNNALGGTAGVDASRGNVGKGGDPRGMADFIRETAKKYNVDPATAVAVAKSEGLGKYTGDGGTSFGAFQLHTGGGLGDQFMKETGLDPRNPANEKAMIDWTLKNASKTGWGPYHGAANSGIGSRAGIGVMSQAGGGAFSGGMVKGVDARIQEIVSAASKHLPPGYSVRMSSGYRGPNVPNHNGNAADYQIIGPDGTPLSNRGADPTGMYHNLARNAYGEMLARHPELKGRFAWGGAFGTRLGGGGVQDLMHFDINGERGHWLNNRMSRMGAVPGERYGDHGASMADHIRGHRPLSDGELLRRGMKATDAGKMEGSASLNVAFENMPRGTRVSSKFDGMFKEVKLNRGTPMNQSSQDA